MRLINDDFLNVVKTIPSTSIDCVITDCPYHIVAGGIGNNPNEPKGVLRRRFQSDGTNCSNKWVKKNESAYISAVRQGKMFEHNDIKFSEWLPDVYRVLKDDCHCYIMINGRNLMKLQQEAEKVGFQFQNLLVWKKQNATPSQYYMQQCEFILLLKKGHSRPINNLGTMNCFDIPNIIGKKVHPTEKPIELMKIMVENSTNENDVVLDPFMGSGSTGVACKLSNRDFIGIEIDKTYFDIANKRIEEVSSPTRFEQLELFGA